jgi:hypothetical protein
MIMSALSPKARDVVRAGRALHRPTAADQQRIQSALCARLGVDLPFIEPSPPPVRPLRQLLTGTLVGVGVLGALLLGARPTPGERALHLRPIKVQVATPTQVVSPAPAEAPALPRLASTDASAPTTTPAVPPADRLGQEVTLLMRATTSLHARRPAEALTTLEEHRRRFPSGLLAEERRAATAQALCALGRRAQGLTELAGVRSQSATAAHARAVCAVSDAETN